MSTPQPSPPRRLTALPSWRPAKRANQASNPKKARPSKIAEACQCQFNRFQTIGFTQAELDAVYRLAGREFRISQRAARRRPGKPSRRSAERRRHRLRCRQRQKPMAAGLFQSWRPAAAEAQFRRLPRRLPDAGFHPDQPQDRLARSRARHFAAVLPAKSRPMASARKGSTSWRNIIATRFRTPISKPRTPIC